MRAFIQFNDKELEDMTLEELRIERKVHSFMYNKYKSMLFHLDRHLHWMHENLPPIDLEEERAKRDRGEITTNMYASKCSQYNNRERNYKATIAENEYVDRFMQHEKAVVLMIDERIEKVKAMPKRKPGAKSIDPRKRGGRNNPKKSYDSKPMPKRLKPLKGHDRHWQYMKQKDKSAETALQRRQPITTWDYSKLKASARAAGYYTEETMLASAAHELEVTINGAKRLLESGKLSWSQAMLIGALFEMTPAVFCDVFMNGYFKEIAEGKYVAQVDDKDALRNDTLQIQRIRENDNE